MERWLRMILGLILAVGVALHAGGAWAEEEWTGKLGDGTAIRTVDLWKILDEHKIWLECIQKNTNKIEQQKCKGRASLSGASLKDFQFRDIDLSGADFSMSSMYHVYFIGVLLGGANFQGAYLGGCNIINTSLRGANLSKIHMHETKLKNVNLFLADVSEGFISFSTLDEVNCHGVNLKNTRIGVSSIIKTHFTKAKLNNASMTGPSRLNKVDFSDADMRESDLSNMYASDVYFDRADLRMTDLHESEIYRASFRVADLRDADLRRVNINEADLFFANLSGADLSWGVSHDADFTGANIDKAKLTGIDLYNVLYERVSGSPLPQYVSGIKGISTLRFNSKEGYSGVLYLRKIFQNTGLRDLEREATYIIEKHKLQYEDNIIERVMFSLVDVVCAFGLEPSRPLLWLAGLIPVFSLIYIIPIYDENMVDGIYFDWSRQRIRKEAGDKYPVRLDRKGFVALSWALYFSLVSAFHFGWRELSLGNWIVRLQRGEYVLRPTGWIRSIAGIQSLISLFLLVMWFITTFSRPFG